MKFKQLEENWYYGFDETYVPIIYRSDVNIGFLGVEKLHPFDSKKYEKIANLLLEGCMKGKNFYSAKQATTEQVLSIHTQEYLDSLSSSYEVAKVLEFTPLMYVPNYFLWKAILNPMLYQLGATILGGEMALKFGWSVCLSGGMHHASSNKGGGWCVFSDIPISIKNLVKKGLIKKAMIVDLDVHQGNGHETDKKDGLMFDGNDKKNLFIVDTFQSGYPNDTKCMDAINAGGLLVGHVDDEYYLESLDTLFKEENTVKFKPDVIFYNAGTDVYLKDPLGRFNVTKGGIIKRDEMVFQFAFDNKIPICMVLSGGYSEETSVIIHESIENLVEKFKLFDKKYLIQ